MQLEGYRPRPMLVTRQSAVLRPKFPVVDAHNHLAEPFGGGWDRKPFEQLIAILDEAGIKRYIDLDGGWGETLLEQHLDLFKARAPERFCIFGGVDWKAWPAQGNHFGKWAAGRLRQQVERGAEGLKIWKGFGLNVVDHNGKLVRINDPRLDELWNTAGVLHLPVTIHIADPLAFFEPLDETNERWEELHAHPDWHFPSPPYPPFMALLNDFRDLVTHHSQVTFIGAHVGCYAENLGWVSEMLEACSNFHVDISARISELGRQPYSSRSFFMRFADRILFGIDAGPDLETYQVYYRFLESADEYFNYMPGDIPAQGRWSIYGLDLPDAVLEKVYLKNAERLIPTR